MPSNNFIVKLWRKICSYKSKQAAGPKNVRSGDRAAGV